MSVSDKLKIIAENEQKVFAAGKEKGLKEATEIVKTINEVLATLVVVE